MSKKDIFSYTWYPYDWMSSEKVFDLTLSQRGLYRELIDLCMTEDNKVKINFNGWARKFNTSVEEIVSILPILEGLDLIIVEDDYLSVPSCVPRLKKISNARVNGSKGGATIGNTNAKKKPETTQKQPKNDPKTNYNYNYNNNDNIIDNNNDKNGGWEKVIGLFPPTKQNGLIEAAMVWNSLEQKEKQSVMRHLNPYIKNTEERFMKQIGKYFNERMWENMKPKSSNKIKMLDFNFIEWFKVEYDFNRFNDARSELASLQIEDPETFKQIEQEYKQLKMTKND